jgi:hypothetical protein
VRARRFGGIDLGLAGGRRGVRTRAAREREASGDGCRNELSPVQGEKFHQYSINLVT